MTGPAVPADDGEKVLIAALAEAIAVALLPIVQAYAEQRAAEEATRALADLAQRFRDLGQVGAYCVVQARIEARAAPLSAAHTEEPGQ